jgi:hypothetical protein
MIGYGNSMFLRRNFDEPGTAPVNTISPVISGDNIVGSTLTTTNGTWTGTAPISYTYQWYKGASMIVGATSITFVLTQSEAGNTSNITCQVKGTNAFGNSTANSNTYIQIMDFDAKAFLSAALISDGTQRAATNSFCIDLKGYSIWSKMKALYPFVTDKIVEADIKSQMKFNLKDPRDLNAAFRLFWNGGGSWSANGYTPNGINGWANTYLVTQGTLGLNSTSYGVYSRTNVDRNAPSIGNVTGAAPSECSLWLRSSNTAFLRVNNSTNASQASTDSRGLFIANRANSTQINLQIRGTQYTYSNNSNSLSTNVFQIGGVNPNFFDNKEIAFAFIGDGLTAQNMTDLNTAVVAFQTALSRNV